PLPPHSHTPTPSAPSTLSLHDALPIWSHTPTLGIHHATISASGDVVLHENRVREVITLAQGAGEAVEDMIGELLGEAWDAELERSEEHTSELQSRENLVCRLLLEKKN